MNEITCRTNATQEEKNAKVMERDLQWLLEPLT